jgi:hypothetical protein
MQNVDLNFRIIEILSWCPTLLSHHPNVVYKIKTETMLANPSTATQLTPMLMFAAEDFEGDGLDDVDVVLPEPLDVDVPVKLELINGYTLV